MQNLYEHAKKCFLISDPYEKVAATYEAVSLCKQNLLAWDEGVVPELLNQPGRLSRPEIVAPRDLNRRRCGKAAGRAAMVHAMAHIELTAVNLCWDAIYRYRDMPFEYYDDWVNVAEEEANHFLALRDRILEMGFDYGDFPAHEELWKMAIATADDVTHRMGVVHRVFESRALDVVPKTIKKFESMGERALVRTLSVIGNEEIGHVGAGSRWFRYRCDLGGLEPDATFFQLVDHYMKGQLRGPFNYEWRQQAGFSEGELLRLRDYE